MMHISFFSITVFHGQWLCTSVLHLNAYPCHLPQNNMFKILRQRTCQVHSELDVTTYTAISGITFTNWELFYFTVWSYRLITLQRVVRRYQGLQYETTDLTKIPYLFSSNSSFVIQVFFFNSLIICHNIILSRWITVAEFFTSPGFSLNTDCTNIFPEDHRSLDGRKWISQTENHLTYIRRTIKSTWIQLDQCR